MPKKEYVLESFQKNITKFMTFLNKELPEEIKVKEQEKKLQDYDLMIGYSYLSNPNIISKHDKKRQELKIDECYMRDKVKDYYDYTVELYKKENVTKADVDEFKERNNSLSNSLFRLNSNAEWKADKYSRSAIRRYNTILLHNDLRKMEYFGKIAEKGINREFSLKEILQRPIPPTEPKVEYHHLASIEKFLDETFQKMEKTESLLHKNSKEYAAMRSALIDLEHTVYDNRENALNDKEVDTFDIGSKLEALQEAAMKYAETKGVGQQRSKRGQARMHIALDICSETIDFMRFCASKEKMKDIQDFEKGLTEKTINKQEKNEIENDMDENIL